MILTMWRNQIGSRPLSVVRHRSKELPRTTDHEPRTHARGFTLVEMLIAMAITLVMMGAVVTLFANVSNSVRNRRAVVEMSGQLRHVRNVLQRDLQGATCPGLVWQRPEENQGYIEIIEGRHREGNASDLIDADPGATPPAPTNWPPTPPNPEIDHKTSILPTSNLPLADPRWVSDGAGLGDADDILMLTVRNEHEPFVGRVPESDTVSKTSRIRPNDDDATPFGNWKSDTIESPLAEVVWYSVESPGYTYDPDVSPPAGEVEPSADGFFGEPGMRTIYRRTLLIAPWINPYRFVAPDGTIDDTFQINGSGPTFTAQPGLVRILSGSIEADEVDEAIAALIAFQEAYDLSVRLEFDPLLDSANGGRWKLVANTLGDLTKRENRYEHHFYRPGGQREFPYAVVSTGSEYDGDDVKFVVDPDVGGGNTAGATANLTNRAGYTDIVASYSIDPNNLDSPDPPPVSSLRYPVRPFAYVDEDSRTLATARAMLNDEGEVVRVVHGLVPLARDRRGEDVMLTDVLGFDLRVYDPGAPLFGHVATQTILEPTDPAWTTAYVHEDNMDDGASTGAIGNGNGEPNVEFPFVGQGAYVDLGYGFDDRLLADNPGQPPGLPVPVFAPAFASTTRLWFFAPETDMQLARFRSPPVVLNRGVLTDVYRGEQAPGYAVYDTWSFHYENNGVNEDDDEINGTTKVWQRRDNDAPGSEDDILQIDEGTNGLDDPGVYFNGGILITPAPTMLGPDDVGERETAPPYDRPLRSVQVVLRLYERDSRQIRQVSVNQSFVPE